MRMVYGYMGETNFWNSVREYLKLYEYGNARSEHLWDVMSKHAPGLDFSHWTL